MALTRIIIIGGGFSGVACAQKLRKHISPQEAEIVLFDQENHMVFSPLLGEVAGATIDPDAVAVPLRQMLPTVQCRTESVENLYLSKNQVEYRDDEGVLQQISYDHVVLASGGIVNMSVVPGMADQCFPLKTIGDAMALRNHVIRQMEKAEVETDKERRRWLLSFLVVGGSFSGVEVAGEINDLTRGSLRFFPNLSAEEIQVTLIHSRDEVLPQISQKLRVFAKAAMEKQGVKFLMNARATLITPQGVHTKDGDFLSGATIVSTIGNIAGPLIVRMEAPKEKGFILTDLDLRISGTQNAWAIGDCAKNINSYDNQPAPTTGQFAIREGLQAAQNIIRLREGQTTKPFYFRPLGQLCSIGGHQAVAEILGIHLSGFFAWILWRCIYLSKMPTWSKRTKIGFDWIWQLVFRRRDLVYAKANATERLSTAYYDAGDFIYRQGAPALNFFVIEEGEVEVIRNVASGSSTELLTVLGQGDFFGHLALLDKRPYNASARARTGVKVLILGGKVFEQISSALLPFKRALAEAARRRSAHLGGRFMAANRILEERKLSEFVEPIPGTPLTEQTTLEEVLSRFNDQQLDYCVVVDKQNALLGTLTRSDLFRAFEIGATKQTPVKDFMNSDPIALTPTESTLLAASTMTEHQLKWLPVVADRESNKLVGYVRAQMILQHVVNEQPAETVPAATPFPDIKPSSL